MTAGDGARGDARRGRMVPRSVGRRWLVAALALGVGVGVTASFVAGCGRPAALRQAIIVDQLSENAANPDFVARAMSILRGGGYQVDYVAGKEVTVRFLQRLPTRQDDLVILRVHSARIMADGLKSDEVALFTGELVDLARYELYDLPAAPATAVAARLTASPATADPGADTLSLEEQSRLIPVFYDPAKPELPRFGLRPLFIERDLAADFKPGCVVILMGCDGLRSQRLAEAFAHRGVAAFVSWDQPISARHTDAATERLLELWVGSGVSLDEAVAQTMTEVGPDPDSGGRLAIYRPTRS